MSGESSCALYLCIQQLQDDPKASPTFMEYGIGRVIAFTGAHAEFQITNQSTRMLGLYNIPDAWKPGFHLGIDVHNIQSHGYVKLNKENLHGLSIMEVNYLEKEEDMDACVKALQILQKDWFFS